MFLFFAYVNAASGVNPPPSSPFARLLSGSYEKELASLPADSAVRQVFDVVVQLAVVKELRAKGPQLVLTLTAKIDEVNKGITDFLNNMNLCDKLEGADPELLAKLPAMLNSTVQVIGEAMTNIKGAMERVESAVLPQLAKCEPLIKTAVSAIEVGISFF